MSKCETFDRKQTNWNGLWWHPQYAGYSSATINLSQLKKFKGSVRMYMRKNKNFNGGENGRPNYIFSLKDSDSPMFTELQVEEDNFSHLYSSDDIRSVAECVDGLDSDVVDRLIQALDEAYGG